MKNTLFTVGIILILVGGILYLAFLYMSPAAAPTTEDETPASLRYENASADVIVIDAPRPGGTIASTFTLSGTARGYWFFEASFPFEVRDADGNLLLQTYAEAQSEWMTTEFVPFSRTVSIEGTYTGPATLILRKDNPSGLPEHDAHVSFPVIIK